MAEMKTFAKRIEEAMEKKTDKAFCNHLIGALSVVSAIAIRQAKAKGIVPVEIPKAKVRGLSTSAKARAKKGPTKKGSITRHGVKYTQA